jgi:chorismate mutase / prephenate dehydrogenase
VDGEPNIDELRAAITAIDESLLDLLRRRMELAGDVGCVKAEAGLPVVARDVEERVLGRARQHADACGVSEDVMVAIFQAIMRGSVERQHRVGVHRRRQRGGHVLIVGGSGAMGHWLSSFLPLVGHRVDVADPAGAPAATVERHCARLDEVGDLAAYDFIVVAVPLAVTPSVLAEVVARRPPGLVVEIASIKSHLAPVLEQAARSQVRVSSLHPMFGPGKSPYEPLTFVLACREDAERERQRVETLLRHPYTEVIAIPFDHHDRLMGWLLGLAHLTGMVFGAALAGSGLTAHELRECASTTFLRQVATAMSVLSEDPALYFDIQRLNPHRVAVYQATRAALDQLVGQVEAGDADGFCATLASARHAVSGD